MIPNKSNFCGGAFSDWLEVNLISKCNGKCSWCIDKMGYHPTKKERWDIIATMAINHGAKNIILLGGEPTLYKDLKSLIYALKEAKRNVYITTNGSKLTPEFIQKNLSKITCVNISIHHYDLKKNEDITGIALKHKVLWSSIKELHKNGATVRLNCNCIVGNICDEMSILEYIRFAHSLNADNVRFAELKNDRNNFVDIGKILDYKYGLNNDPFTCGCNSNAIINKMPVNFRQMCGLQTTKRPLPTNPKQVQKKVLYYDGKIYDGWQITKEIEIMTDKEIVQLLEDVKKCKKSVAEASFILGHIIGKIKTENVFIPPATGGGCNY